MWYAKNKEKHGSRVRKHRERNWEKIRLREKINEAARDRAPGKLSSDIVDQLMAKQGGRCACCWADLDEFHIDHIIPLALNGTNTDSNVQLLLPECNMKKRAMHPNDWWPMTPLFSRK